MGQFKIFTYHDANGILRGIHPNTAKAVMKVRGDIILLKIKRLDLFGDQR